MWNRGRSVLLSLVGTRIMMLLGLTLAVLLPLLCFNGFFESRALINPDLVLWLMPVYYAFCVPAYVILFSLDRMLVAIKKDEVFSAGNVRYMRVISWCCFGIAIILLASGMVSVVFVALAILAAFFGIVLRVVKNLFAAAVELKDENDFTI